MEIDWIKYGFVEDSDEDREGVYHRKDFPFDVWVVDGFLTLCINDEYTISKGKIPATNQAIVLLLKAFNLPKL